MPFSFDSFILKSFLLPIVFISALNLYAQDLQYELPENGNKMFTEGNYGKSLEIYRELYKNNLDNVKYKYRFGVSLLYTYNWKDATETLESVSKKTSCPEEVWFHLGKLYHLTNHYDKAIKTYKKYLISKSLTEELTKKTNRHIEMCENAKMLIKRPILASFENLGKYVNSRGKDYLPLITPNESILFFTTRREGTTGRIYDIGGYYTADIFSSKYRNNKWSRSRSIGVPNSYGNEQTAGISEDGNTILYYVDNPLSKNNLQMSKKSRSSYRKATKIKGSRVNKKESKQIAATISNDRNTLIFASDRDGGNGGYDLYTCKKLPNKKWGIPTPMGTEINTSYNELYPYLTDDGKTLYFASEGHNSIGGYDIFKSEYDQKNGKWSSAKNIGYPLNTADDDMNISFSANKKYAYTARYRKDSYGGIDIYRVNLEQVTPSYTAIKGLVLDADSNIVKEPLLIEVFSKTTGDLYGMYEVNEKGKYLMILSPDEYEINVDVPGKGMFIQPLQVKGRQNYKKEISRDLHLTFNTPPK